MNEDHTVRVHFNDGHMAIVPAKDIHWIGEEGARHGIALVDGQEVPIYNRVEWGFLWEEQMDMNTWLALQAEEKEHKT